MDNTDQDEGLVQSFSQTQTVTSNTGVSSKEQQKQLDESEHQPKSNQETPQPKKDPPPLALIKFRIQQLHNRRFLLLKMQHFRKKQGDNSSGTTEGMTCEDSDEVCELETIQKELEELLVKMEELEKQGKSRAKDGQQDALRPTFYKTETPTGGIYMLPPPQLTQEDGTLGPVIKTLSAAQTPTDMIVPVDSLGETPAVTQCPTCREVILTETRSTSSVLKFSSSTRKMYNVHDDDKRRKVDEDEQES
ncbi:uncharacterized protein LOC111219662 [Seriola dumerili]|uniref:uncharacterized protein LOC111219662 n=1 Tax=Seriola dumerili TaxID=41447 RepID=UPI000BBF1D76|nr:uncharacterized protein LOC111219662 [Seriola dumerili]